MMYKTRDVRDYEFTPQDRLFLDTNIWFYIHGQQEGSARRTNIYSRIFKRVLAAKSKIYIDVLIVSEFINTFARQEWRRAGSSFGDFKRFRSSPVFKASGEKIGSRVRWIMQYCSRVESSFMTVDMDALLTDYESGGSDFNDQIIVEICKANDFTLITNDGDFRGQDISILTANRRLL